MRIFVWDCSLKSYFSCFNVTLLFILNKIFFFPHTGAEKFMQGVGKHGKFNLDPKEDDTIF